MPKSNYLFTHTLLIYTVLEIRTKMASKLKQLKKLYLLMGTLHRGNALRAYVKFIREINSLLLFWKLTSY